MASPPPALPMISPEKARHFAEDWVRSWNAHDLTQILAHYTDDFSMTSPFIAAYGEPSGVLKGKDKVGDYWGRALARMPNLHFEIIDVTGSVNSVCIYYKNTVRNLRVVEWFRFGADGKVSEAIAHYHDKPA